MITIKWLLVLVVALIILIVFLFKAAKREERKTKKILENQLKKVTPLDPGVNTGITVEEAGKNLDEAFGDLKTKLTLEKNRIKFHPGGGCKYRCPFRNKVIGIGSMLCFACPDHIDHGKDYISEWLICSKLSNYEGDVEQIPEVGGLMDNI